MIVGGITLWNWRAQTAPLRSIKNPSRSPNSGFPSSHFPPSTSRDWTPDWRWSHECWCPSWSSSGLLWSVESRHYLGNFWKGVDSWGNIWTQGSRCFDAFWSWPGFWIFWSCVCRFCQSPSTLWLLNPLGFNTNWILQTLFFRVKNFDTNKDSPQKMHSNYQISY